jgi:hypothetical protein
MISELTNVVPGEIAVVWDVLSNCSHQPGLSFALHRKDGKKVGDSHDLFPWRNDRMRQGKK